MNETANESKIVVFDLDDTLYPEHDFVVSGFQAVDEELRRRNIHGFLPVAKELFQPGLRGKVFDAALAQLGIQPSPELIGDLIEIYRSHLPQLRLFPDALWVLDHYNAAKIGLLTDGFSRSQRNKTQALGIDSRFAAKVYTEDLGREHCKPSPLPFKIIAKMLEMENEMERLVYVADNPKKDFIAPNQLGWTTIRIQRKTGEYSGIKPVDAQAASHYEIHTLEELPKVLRN